MRKKENHRTKYYIPVQTDTEDNDEVVDERVPHNGNSMSSPGNLDKPNGVEDTQIFLPGVRITSDPTKYGNCQFYALAHQLSNLGIHRRPIC